MTVSYFEDIDQSALEHFDLSFSQFKIFKFLDKDSKIIINDKLLANKLSRIYLDAEADESEIKNAKKVYILPKLCYNGSVIKNIVKEYNFKITKDLFRADLIIGDKDSCDTLFNNQSRLILITSDSDYNYYKLRDHFNNYNAVTTYSYANPDFIVPLGINVAHMIDTKNIKTCNIEDLVEQSDLTEITDEVVSTIQGLMDNNEFEMVSRLAMKLDYNKHMYNVKKVVNAIFSRSSRFGRDRTFINFMYEKDFQTIHYEKDENLCLKWHAEGKLSSEDFQQFERDIRSQISITNKALYNFKVSIKEEFRKYYENRS